MSEPTITMTVGEYLKLQIKGIAPIKDILVAKIYDDKIYLVDEMPDFEDGEGVDLGSWNHHIPKKISQYINVKRNTAKPLAEVLKELKEFKNND